MIDDFHIPPDGASDVMLLDGDIIVARIQFSTVAAAMEVLKALGLNPTIAPSGEADAD